MLAAMHGKQELVELLLAHGAEVNAKNHQGCTALVWAVEYEHSEVVQALLEAGADVTATNALGRCVLGSALKSEHRLIIELLLAKIKQATQHLKLSLHQAATEGQLDIFKQHIESGMDIDMRDEAGHSPLLLATQHGRISIIKYLLKRSADVTSQGYSLLNTALNQAFITQNFDCLNTLLTVDCEQFFKAFQMWQPVDGILYKAVKVGHKKLVQAILASSVSGEITNPGYEAALLSAAIHGRHDMVVLLIDAWTEYAFFRSDLFVLAIAKAMRHAAEYNQPQVITVLLEKGYDINVKDGNRGTALTQAVESGHTQLVKMLLSKGADRRVRNFYDENLLMIAAKYKHKDLTAFFIAEGFAVNEVNARGRTALMYAAHPKPYTKAANDALELMKLLMANGADPNVQDLEGCTALILAAKWNDKAPCEYLLSVGASVNAKTNNGLNTLDIVLRLTGSADLSAGRKALIKLLLEAGADFDAELYKLMREFYFYHPQPYAWHKWLIQEYTWIRRRHAMCLFHYKHHIAHQHIAVIDLIKADKTMAAITEIKSNASLCKYREQTTGNTLLHFAAITGNLVIIQALIHQGIDSALKNKAGQSAIELLAEPAKPFMQALLKEPLSFSLDYEQVLI